jgi:hypothetical protein
MTVNDKSAALGKHYGRITLVAEANLLTDIINIIGFHIEFDVGLFFWFSYTPTNASSPTAMLCGRKSN